MADKPVEIPIKVSPQPVSKVNPIAAWFDADTDEKKLAAVLKFPELADIFSLAQTIKNSK